MAQRGIIKHSMSRRITLAVAAVALVSGAFFAGGTPGRAIAAEHEEEIGASEDELVAQPRRGQRWREGRARARARERQLPSVSTIERRISNWETRRAARAVRISVRNLAIARNEAEVLRAADNLASSTGTLNNVASGFNPSCFASCAAQFNICVASGVLAIFECRLDQGTCQLGCLL